MVFCVMRQELNRREQVDDIMEKMFFTCRKVIKIYDLIIPYNTVKEYKQ